MSTRHYALTGGIASGKSAVAELLAGHGATIIDADLLAREVVRPGTPGHAAVVEEFGPAVVRGDGTLDRPALRAIVFADAAKRDRLNAIVHPRVRALRDDRLAEAVARGDSIVISDIPLLFEVGLEAEFDGVIVVDAPVAVRLARLMANRALSETDASAMIEAQWPAERKRAGATWVIDNDGSREQLAARVAALWPLLSAATHAPRSTTASSATSTLPEP